MNEEGVRAEVRRIAGEARTAAGPLSQTSGDERNVALRAMAEALRVHTGDIVAANDRDMEHARKVNTKESLIDRLMLDAGRIEGMASSLDELADLPDPLGKVQEKRTLDSGLELMRVSVPLGVVAVIYEARPNVTADAAGICLKAGNSVILRGGSLAMHSNTAIADILHEAAVNAGLPRGCVGIITTDDRSATDELMRLHGVVDVLIPRGGAGLIRYCVENSKVPVIETGTGNCHVYVDGSADSEKARAIVVNAKCRRYGVCNAAETLLVDTSMARTFLPVILRDLADRGVLLHCDALASQCAVDMGLTSGDQYVDATGDDWATEYLAPEIAVRCVDGVGEAIDHINRYGTRHSEAIVAQDVDACERFLACVDAAAVYTNASTAFTDGGEFGLGAEIGISTQKLHVRGPFALNALTSYKYLLRGDGQVRA